MAERTEALCWLNGGKAEGVEGLRGRCSSCGETRQQNSISHVGGWGVGSGAHKAVGAAHSGIVIRGVGGWDAADKVWRNGSFPQNLPPLWEAWTQNTPVTVWLFKLREFKKTLNH